MSITDVLGLPPRLDGALCAQADPEAWFPRPGVPNFARAICRACPALDQCREWIDQHETTHRMEDGIWAGEAPQRRVLRRRLERLGVTACVSCDRPMRPARTSLDEYPDTIMYGASGKCRTCLDRERRARRRATYRRNAIASWSNRHCTECGRPVRDRRISASEMPGTIVAGSHGRCSTCTTRARRKES